MKKGILNATTYFTAFILLLAASQTLFADHFAFPAISIIIDDLGYRGVDDLNALKLPGPVAYAIMPYAPYSVKISELAHQSGNDVILHLPMEAVENDKNRFLGPGALRMEMSENQFITTLSKNFQSIPNIVGVNNHMGSLLTGQAEKMKWLMEYLSLHDIFYVDSLTSSETVAGDVAKQKHVPFIKRDVFLDNNLDRTYIEKQFRELVTIARKNGTAIAIGHPHPETIEVLDTNLRRLKDYGVRLISLEDMIDARHQTHIHSLSSLR